MSPGKTGFTGPRNTPRIGEAAGGGQQRINVRAVVAVRVLIEIAHQDHRHCGVGGAGEQFECLKQLEVRQTGWQAIFNMGIHEPERAPAHLNIH